MGLGLAFKCFFAAMGSGDVPERLKKALLGIKDPPEIKEVVREVTLPPKEVIREVPVEVIKEVPKEVVKEVVKLVPDTHGPAQVLALLQQDGRLLDFLNENIDGYADDQVGAAVREIHGKCRKALWKYITLEPVRAEGEGDSVTISADADPSAVRLSGNATAKRPLTGVLRHRGWKAARIELPTRPTGADPSIIMPAEVEVE